MGFITMNNHHLGYSFLNLFQASKSRKSKQILAMNPEEIASFVVSFLGGCFTPNIPLLYFVYGL